MGFVKKEEQIHEGKGSPAPSGHNGGFSGSSKSIPLVPDPNSKCHGAAHLSRPCPSSGDLASTLSTVPSMICPRISPSSAGATSVSPVIGKPQTSSSINSPVNNSPGSPHPLSPTLVHFPAYSSSASCHLQESDVSEIDVHWKHCLIGFVAGKCLGLKSRNKKRSHEPPTGSTSSNPSAEIAAVVQQVQHCAGSPKDLQEDPMTTVAAIAEAMRTQSPDRKRSKVVVTEPLGSISHHSAAIDTSSTVPLNRQYITQSKAAAIRQSKAPAAAFQYHHHSDDPSLLC
ncbi:hypothetical protein D5086_030453 [Populus alba]|uniref:Uncharacterized protein n=1 Tax=Populus alba TaxID=43335 RepID=A0ACC4APH3_POPAL